LPNQGRRLLNVEVVYNDRAFKIEQVGFSLEMPWSSASNAFCAFAGAPQIPSLYRVLDLKSNVWIPEPSFVGDLKTDSIALIANDFIAKIGNDPVTVSAMLQIVR